MWEYDFEAARLTDQECDVCARLRLTERGENPNLVAELSTGYVVLGDDQYIRGYTVLICKHCSIWNRTSGRSFLKKWC